MSDEFPHVVRVGLAVELSSGKRLMIFSDDTNAEINIDTEYQQELQFWGDPTCRPTSALTSITISGLRHFIMQDMTEPVVAQAIDSIRKELKGNHDCES